MTGDGLRLALAGAELAAAVALEVLAGPAAARPRAPRAGARAGAPRSGRSGGSTARCARWSPRRAASRPRPWRRASCRRSSSAIIRYAGDCPASRISRMTGASMPPAGHRRPHRRRGAADDGAAKRCCRRSTNGQLRARGAVEPRGRCHRHDAVGVSACRLSPMAHRRRAGGPAPPIVLARRPRAVRPRQGAQGVGHRVARPALELPRAGAARRAAGHAGPYRFIAHPNYLAVVGEMVERGGHRLGADHRRAGDDRLRLLDARAHPRRRSRAWPS